MSRKHLILLYFGTEGQSIKGCWLVSAISSGKLPHDISTEGTHVSVEKLSHENNLFVEKESLFENYRHYDTTEKGDGTGFSVAVVWSH